MTKTGEFKNILNTAKLKMGRPNKMIVLCMLIIAVILVCVSPDVSHQELGRPIFLEGIFGLTHLLFIKGFVENLQFDVSCLDIRCG
jgi:hypothetical protein